MTMRCAVLAILMLAALAACSGEQPPASTEEPAASQGLGEGELAPVLEVTPGDVEQKVFINATIAEADRTPSMRIEEVKDKRNRLNLVTVDVYQPYPQDIPITFTIDSRQDWKDTPVVLRGKVRLEGRPETFGDFQAVLGEKANLKDIEHKVDLMDQLPEVPETLLVLMRLNALLMVPGTDEKTVDPATATAPETRSTELMSNAIRLHFHNEPAPASAMPEVTPTAPEGAPAPAALEAPPAAAAQEATPAPVAPEAVPAPATPETAPASAAPESAPAAAPAP